jgi:hypothetical protein
MKKKKQDGNTSLKLSLELRDEIIEALEGKEKNYSRIIRNAVTCLKGATTIDEVMTIKKGLMIKLVDALPMGPSTCYFCKLYFPFHCGDCEYGAERGICTSLGEICNDSSFGRIEEALAKLEETIEQEYW